MSQTFKNIKTVIGTNAETIEINYISPMSNYIFDNKLKRYYLVFINTSLNNDVAISKIELLNIENITESIRSYHVGKGIKLLSGLQYPFYSLRLFEHNINTNKINLIFTGNANINEIEFNNIKIIELFMPTKIIGNYQSTIYKNETSFLEEQFHNYESLDNKNKCMLFMTKLKKSDKELIKPYVFRFDLINESEPYIYHRYQNNIIKEQQLVSIDNFCKSNTFEDYIKFIKTYNIDVNRYLKKDKDTFKSMFMRKINLTTYRPLIYNVYLNNNICSPVDGRMKGFDINSATKFKFNNELYHYKDLVTKPYELLNGSGFMNRIIPSDYQRIHMPYPANLKEISIYNAKDKQYYISLRFESDYFIPPNVHEREYISVVYGHNTRMSRGYPELVEKQPKTNLIFYLIMFGNSSNESIAFTNNKLIDIKKIMNVNSTHKIKETWFEQGEEVGVFNCCFGNTVFLINRPIDFASDIKFYSKLEANQSLHKSIESYIKVRDIVGLIL